MFYNNRTTKIETDVSMTIPLAFSRFIRSWGWTSKLPIQVFSSIGTSTARGKKLPHIKWILMECTSTREFFFTLARIGSEVQTSTVNKQGLQTHKDIIRTPFFPSTTSLYAKDFTIPDKKLLILLRCFPLGTSFFQCCNSLCWKN